MKQFDFKKYPSARFAPSMPTRQWPSKQLEAAPLWCSVDLRDGNQALIDPMTIPAKLRFWDTLLECGFKEIEIGFPSAAQVEFDFARKLVEGNLIPDDVSVQVLTQAREHLIKRTYESLEGVKKAIVHVYNSTSPVQREKAYKKSKAEIMQIAVQGAQWVKEYAEKYPDTEWSFQYSPESFSQTEPEYAVEVCEAVCRVWQPENGQRVILNLPATVETTTPNIFADQVEYFCQNLPSRADVIISLHTHNDRGCGIAAAELGRLAGADRIEGTLLGNGERTGNMDIITMAMNLYSQGIDPQLDFSDMAKVVQCVTECNQLPIHPRHPYAGELVFTAFSGSHQDAIKKCLEDGNQGYGKDDLWDVAYLPIDPQDLGRSYEDVVRINSQSGKGGIAYVMQKDHGIEMPRWLQIRFSRDVQKLAEDQAKELSVDEIWQLFQSLYMSADDTKPAATDTAPYRLHDYSISKTAENDGNGEGSSDGITANLKQGEKIIEIKGQARGALGAFIKALKNQTGQSLRVLNYNEHALSVGTRAEAIAYVELSVNDVKFVGVATSPDTVGSMFKATLAALNMGLAQGVASVDVAKAA